jgi:hypothetical protein
MPALMHTGKKPRTTRAAVTTGALAAIITAIRQRSRLALSGLLWFTSLGACRGYSQLAQPISGLHGFI